MEKSFKLLNLIGDLMKYGNKNSYSDVAVALELLHASIRGAYYNIKINFSFL